VEEGKAQTIIEAGLLAFGRGRSGLITAIVGYQVRRTVRGVYGDEQLQVRQVGQQLFWTTEDACGHGRGVLQHLLGQLDGEFGDIAVICVRALTSG
jgi:hypothetical protein